MIAYAGLDHVQLAAPRGSEDEARGFYGELLGMTELPKPADMALRGGCWFRCGGQEIHIGVEDDFRPAKKAHPGIALGDAASFTALRARLEAKGIVVTSNAEIEGVERFFAADPWGNRLEFVLSRAQRP